MELPSSRELELETLLRQRDAQLAELTDEVTRLRQFLNTQPGPSTSEPILLPPAVVSTLFSRLNLSSESSESPSNTVTSALTQRVKVLQEENDELYDILQYGETGRLKDETRGLRKTVSRLETALREAHHVIESLSTEVDKSMEAVMATARQNAKSHSYSPRNSNANTSHSSHSRSASGDKAPPTGPRAFKKPRLNEASHSPSSSSRHKHSTHHSGQSSRGRDDSHSPQQSTSIIGAANRMAVESDDDSRHRPRAADHGRPRDKAPRDDRDRDRDRDGNRSRRSGGGGGGGSGRGGRRGGHGVNGRGNYQSSNGRSTPSTNSSAMDQDRTLAARMGL